jgi:SAM-dependent methyltransferase
VGRSTGLEETVAEIEEATYYGAEWADLYETYQVPSAEETDAAVATLLALADGRPVRELAAGTGRVAVPLARAGLRVVATDISSEMLAVLSSKEGADLLETHCEDAATPGEPGFGVVAILLNSVFAAITAQHQRAIFEAAASWLLPEGLFVVEHAVPNLFGWPAAQCFDEDNGSRVFRELNHWDPVTQRVDLQFTFVDGGKAFEQAARLRWIWPAECDLMAELMGFDLAERWSDWERSDFGPGSRWAVSVYRLRD